MAEAGCLALAGALNRKNDSSVRQQGGDLTSLDASDFLVVGGDDEGGDVKGRPQFYDVLRIAAENDPTDALRGCGACYMRKSSGSSRLEDDRVGTGSGRGLDAVEQLLTLDDSVVLRVDDIEIRSQPGGRLASALHLFDLEIVIVVRYREHESRLGHAGP